MIRSSIKVGSQINQTAPITQKKGTPRKNPKNNGGSPIGVNEPPMLLTIKIFKEGKEVFSQAGVMSPTQVLSLIED